MVQHASHWDDWRNQTWFRSYADEICPWSKTFLQEEWSESASKIFPGKSSIDELKSQALLEFMEAVCWKSYHIIKAYVLCVNTQ